MGPTSQDHECSVKHSPARKVFREILERFCHGGEMKHRAALLVCVCTLWCRVYVDTNAHTTTLQYVSKYLSFIHPERHICKIG